MSGAQKWSQPRTTPRTYRRPNMRPQNPTPPWRFSPGVLGAMAFNQPPCLLRALCVSAAPLSAFPPHAATKCAHLLQPTQRLTRPSPAQIEPTPTSQTVPKCPNSEPRARKKQTDLFLATWLFGCLASSPAPEPAAPHGATPRHNFARRRKTNPAPRPQIG
jgi:hypothetical protein